MNYWKRWSREQIEERVFKSLQDTIDCRKKTVLGLPGSHLDGKVFYHQAPFLKDAPFLSTLIQNPNHIGCHTLGESESFFAGTQQIERELIHLCAEDILKGETGQQDGYVASGGTESNIQACWMYRNYFVKKHGCHLDEIAILCSEDSHYSMHKAANLLNLKILTVSVDFQTRKILTEPLEKTIAFAQRHHIHFFIVVANMMTTMFGSVDDVDLYVHTLEKRQVGEFIIHVDGAFGGFIYPFSEQNNRLNFQNPHIQSITLDAHKMVQAPFGTGIFLCRKGWMDFVHTSEAQYVKGIDTTLVGSRSGANAVSVWMILMSYGPFGWFEKIHILLYRANWLSQELKKMKIFHYRHPASNIIAIESKHVPIDLALKYGLVPDTYSNNRRWYKIVVMDHVTVDILSDFIRALKEKIMNLGKLRPEYTKAKLTREHLHPDPYLQLEQ